MNKKTKEQYIKLVDFLAKTLGKDYEIVLHDINQNEASIVAIANNYISGRSINSPITGFALELLNKKIFLEKDFLSNYKASAMGKNIEGSTFFIKEENECVGMLCINHDKSRLESIAAQILGNDSINDDVVELLSYNISEVILELTGISVDKLKEQKLKPKEKREIINTIYEKGIFNIKGSVTQLAQILNVSESTIYRIINKFKQD